MAYMLKSSHILQPEGQVDILSLMLMLSIIGRHSTSQARIVISQVEG